MKKEYLIYKLSEEMKKLRASIMNCSLNSM